MTVTSEITTAAGGATCPRCASLFTPQRRNQRYCGRACQAHAARGSRSVHASPEKARQMLERLERLQELNAAFYSARPDQRMGLLKRWLDEARGGNRRLAEVLTCPRFFRRDQGADEKARVCYRRDRTYPPVPFLADQLAQRLLGCRVWEWVGGTAPEPETGEVNGKAHPRQTILPPPQEPPLVRVRRDPGAFLAELRALRAGVHAVVSLPSNLAGTVRDRYEAAGLERPRTWRLAS